MTGNQNEEVYYCGECRQQYQPVGSNEKCRRCGCYTVSWFINRESEAEAKKRWAIRNGK